MRKLYATLILLLVAGCAKDDRAKQGSNLLNVMTLTAAQEYGEATTPPDKDAVATEYFKQAPKFTQALDDYMHDRAPATIDVPVPTPVPAPVVDPKLQETSPEPKCKTGG